MSSSIRVKVWLPSAKKGGELRHEELLFKPEDTASKALETLCRQLNLESSYKIYVPINGTYIRKAQTLSDAGVNDQSTVEIHLKRSVDKIHLCYPLSHEVLKNGASMNSLAPILKPCKISWTAPFNKLIPFVLKQFNVSGKDEYAFRKVSLKEDGSIVKVGKFLNINLSPKENNLQKGGLVVLEPVIFEDKTYDSIPTKSIKKEGYMSKNSKKGDGKVTGMKKRWCVLQGNFLFYFANNKDSTKISGVVDLEYMIMSKEGVSSIKLESAPFTFRTIPHTYVFEVDNEKDRNEWYSVLKHCVVNGDYRRVFGISLVKLFKRPTHTLAPIIKPINQLDATGLDTEGLFREPGNAQKIESLKEDFNAGKLVDLSEVDPHTLGALIKAFLRELPEPLMTYALYKKWVNSETVQQLQENLSELPDANQILLEILLYFFARVLDHKAKNRMDMMTICYTFSPIILQPKTSESNEALADQNHLHKVMKMLVENRFALKFARPKSKKLNLKNKVQVQASYDYVSRGQKNQKGEVDLGFKKGEIMILLEEARSNGWVMAKHQNEQGLIPCNYVTKINPPGEIKISKVNKRAEERKKAAKKAATMKKKSAEQAAQPSQAAPEKTEKARPKSQVIAPVKTPPAPLPRDNPAPSPAVENLYKTKYEAEHQERIKLEEEVSALRAKLWDYEALYGPLNDFLPPPPDDLPPPPMD